MTLSEYVKFRKGVIANIHETDLGVIEKHIKMKFDDILKPCDTPKLNSKYANYQKYVQGEISFKDLQELTYSTKKKDCK